MKHILIIPPDNAGVSKYRFIDPFLVMQNQYKHEFTVDFNPHPPLELSQYDKYEYIVSHSAMLANDSIFQLLQQLKTSGKKLIIDIDDYWELPRTHPLYQLSIKDELKKIPKRLSVADTIVATTPHLANEVKNFINKDTKLVVIPNGLSELDMAFKPTPIQADKIRVGWAGGSSHLEDLRLLDGVSNRVLSSNMNVQFLMAGFDNRMKNPYTGELVSTALPKTWIECESIFTNKYSLLPPDYVNYLLRGDAEHYPNIENQVYRRIPSKDVTEYGKIYNEFDIVLAPLLNNKFNSMKSELKIIEAGFHKKPIIASNVQPYHILKHGVTGFLVDEKTPSKDFFNSIKSLYKNKNMRLEMGLALNEYVLARYSLQKLAILRYQLFN